MGRSIALLLAASVAIGASASARAADLLPPPPMVEPPPPVDFGGWYLRGDVGVGATEISGLRSTFDNPTPVLGAFPRFVQASIGDQAFAGAGFGYKVNNWFRVDATGEYRTAAAYNATQIYYDPWSPACAALLHCADLYHGQVSSAVFLASAYFDLGTFYGVTPFVGGGVGLAHHWFQNLNDWGPQTGGFGFAQNSERTNFSWALTGGLAFNVTPNTKLELAYRYLDMGKVSSGAINCFGGCALERQSFNLTSHDIRLGFRYMLASAPAPALVPMPAPGPLIRKY